MYSKKQKNADVWLTNMQKIYCYQVFLGWRHWTQPETMYCSTILWNIILLTESWGNTFQKSTNNRMLWAFLTDQKMSNVSTKYKQRTAHLGIQNVEIFVRRIWFGHNLFPSIGIGLFNMPNYGKDQSTSLIPFSD